MFSFKVMLQFIELIYGLYFRNKFLLFLIDEKRPYRICLDVTGWLVRR